METKHTPGPWMVVKSEGGAYGAHDFIGVTGPNNVRVADLTSRVRGSGPRSSANANLVSAAPDLLDAALLALEATGPLGTVKECKAAYTALSAAIAKARGDK